jgi:hypothetical protein
MSILNMKLIKDENFLKECNLLIIGTLGLDYGLGTKNCTDYCNLKDAVIFGKVG